MTMESKPKYYVSIAYVTCEGCQHIMDNISNTRNSPLYICRNTKCEFCLVPATVELTIVRGEVDYTRSY